jgi:hypothetical protein
LVKTAAKMSSKEEAKAPPRNPRLPSAIEARQAATPAPSRKRRERRSAEATRRGGLAVW